MGTRICADLRSLAVTSRLFSFAMARFLAGHLDRAPSVFSWFVMDCFIESYHVI